MTEEQQTRVLADAKGKRSEYEDFVVGTEFKPVDWVVSPDQITYFCEANEDYHEWYMVDSPFGGRVCPPIMNFRPVRGLLSAMYNVRGLLYVYETENFEPVKPNVKIHVTGKITNKWIKNDKEFIEFQATGVDESGTLIFRSRRVHVLDAVPRTAPRATVIEKKS